MLKASHFESLHRNMYVVRENAPELLPSILIKDWNYIHAGAVIGSFSFEYANLDRIAHCSKHIR